MIKAARHDADAVLMYGNDAPDMRKVLACHVHNLLAIINKLSTSIGEKKNDQAKAKV